MSDLRLIYEGDRGVGAHAVVRHSENPIPKVRVHNADDLIAPECTPRRL
jgi:hypothetical protein